MEEKEQSQASRVAPWCILFELLCLRTLRYIFTFGIRISHIRTLWHDLETLLWNTDVCSEILHHEQLSAIKKRNPSRFWNMHVGSGIWHFGKCLVLECGYLFRNISHETLFQMFCFCRTYSCSGTQPCFGTSDLVSEHQCNFSFYNVLIQRNVEVSFESMSSSGTQFLIPEHHANTHVLTFILKTWF